MSKDNAVDSAADLDRNAEEATQQKLTHWIESELGATVESISRQDRWRPAWFVKARKNGQPLNLYLRGERNFALAWPLGTEKRVIEILHEEGIPVPRVYGMCPDPLCIVMDWVEGTRDLSAYGEEQRLLIAQEYLQHLSSIHSIDIRRFVEIGMPAPKTSEAIATAFIGPQRVKFEAEKVAPDAFVAFIGRWIDAHTPRDLTEVSLVTGDPGQFLVKDGKITSLLDFEVCHLGSPLSDVACLRVRELEEPLADPVFLMKHYAGLRGLKIDAEKMNFFHLVLAAVTHFMMHPNFHAVRPDLAVWRNWEIKASRQVLSCMADIHGMALERITPPGHESLDQALAFESLSAAISGLPANTPLDDFNKGNALALVKNLAAISRMGHRLNEDELDDLQALLGVRPDSLANGERLLEQAVTDGASDEDLIRFFDRRFQRRRFTLVDHDPRLWIYDMPPLSRELRGLSKALI
jgi:aminoglycoside phosphotransferase (APT) family kinase protein